MKDPWAIWSRIYPVAEGMLLGSALARARNQSFAPIRDCHRVLLLGDGDGRFLSALCRRGFAGEIVSVDVSAAMIARARLRLQQAAPAAEPRVKWVHADLRLDPLPEGPFDGIVAQFFFDNFSTEAAALIVQKMGAEITTDAICSIVDFRPPAEFKGWRRQRQRWLLAFLYRAFRWTAGIEARHLPPIDRLLENQGWVAQASTAAGDSMVGARVWVRPIAANGHTINPKTRLRKTRAFPRNSAWD